MKKYLLITVVLFTTLLSLSSSATENNCLLRDVGNQMNNGHVMWTSSHVRERSLQTPSLEACLAAAKEGLGNEYDAKITTRNHHSRHTHIEHFKVTKVKYQYSEGSFKSKGNIKTRYKDWNVNMSITTEDKDCTKQIERQIKRMDQGNIFAMELSKEQPEEKTLKSFMVGVSCNPDHREGMNVYQVTVNESCSVINVEMRMSPKCN